MMTIASVFKRDETIALSAGILGFFVDYMLNLVMARLLPAHDYGDFRVAYTFAFMASAVVLLGGDRAAPKVLAAPLDRDRIGVAWEYLRFYGVVGLGISCVIIAGVWITGYFYHETWDPNAHHAIGIMILAVPAMAMGALAGRTLQTVGQTFFATMPWRVGGPLIFLVTLIVDHIITGQVSLNEVLWLACSIMLIVAVGQWIVVRRRALRRIEFAPETRQPRAWLALSIPVMAAFLVVVGLGQSDLYFLELLDAEHSVGHYAAALTTAHFIVIIQTTIVALYAPLVARDIKVESTPANDALTQGRNVMAGLLAPVGLVLIVGAAPLMSIFGSGYQDVALELRLLTIGNGAWAMAALYTLSLQYRNRGVTVIVITVVTLLVDSLLNVLLIPRFGTLGAAASSAATAIGAATAIFWIARSTLRS